MADDQTPREPHKEFKDFMTQVKRDLLAQQNISKMQRDDDKHYYTRRMRSITAQQKSNQLMIAKLQKHGDYLKSTSERTQDNYNSGLQFIENMKMNARSLKNLVKNTGDTFSKVGFLSSVLKKNGEVLNKKFEGIRETMKANREKMVHSIQTMPTRMVGGIVNGVTKGVDKLREGLANKHDKLLAYFGNKDARDRMEKKMDERKAGGGDSDFKTNVKDGAKKAGGWLKKMLGVLTTMGTGAFKGIFTKLFPAIGKFLLKNIGKFGLIGLATGLLATFWDDISNFVKKLFSGDSSEGNVVTKEGVKGMLDKLWGFVNDMVKDLFGVDLGKVLADKGIDIGSITTTISEYVTPVVNGFIKVGKALGQGFKNIIKDAFGEGEEKGKMGKFFDNIKKIASSIIDAVSNFTGGLFKTKDGKQKDIGQIVGDLMEHVRKFANMIMDAGNRLTEYILDPRELLGDIKLAFSGLGRIVGNAFTDFIIYAEALVKTGFGKLGNVNEKLAELKAEDAEKKMLEAEKEEKRFQAKFKDAKDITHMTDVGQYIKDMGLQGENKAYWENVLRDIVDSKQRVFEQTNEAIEAAAQGEVEKQLEEYRKGNLKNVLTGDQQFKESFSALAGKMRWTGAGGEFADDNVTKIQEFIQQMPADQAQAFLAKLETLDKTGDVTNESARQLLKDMGITDRRFQKDNEAKEFVNMLVKAENLKTKDGTMFKNFYDNIGEDQADKLLSAGFQQNTQAIMQAVQHMAKTTANLDALPAILAQLPGAVAQGSANGIKNGAPGVVQQQESSSQSGR